MSLSGLEEILGLNDYLSADEILLEIIKKSLREFEKTVPLVLDMKTSISALGKENVPDGYREIKSNFTLYLDCKIGEDQVLLVPNSTPKYRVGSLSMPAACNYTYFTDYRRPFVYMQDVPNYGDLLYIRGICSRPIIPDFLPDRTFNPSSGRAGIYWMNVEEGYKGTLFLDICMMNLLDFIRQTKASVSLPGISIDILGNVDNAYLELRSRVEQEILQSGWSGDTII